MRGMNSLDMKKNNRWGRRAVRETQNGLVKTKKNGYGRVGRLLVRRRIMLVRLEKIQLKRNALLQKIISSPGI